MRTVLATQAAALAFAVFMTVATVCGANATAQRAILVADSAPRAQVTAGEPGDALCGCLPMA